MPAELHPYIWRLPRPRLFADLDGGRVQVVMASRFGDLGVSRNLGPDARYERRGVRVAELSNFSDTP